MRVTEDVQLTDLDRPNAWYMNLVSATEYEAKDLGDSIILQARYEPGRYEDLLQRIERAHMQPTVFRGFSTEWADEEFSRADLLELSFPDLDIDGFYEQAKCAHCTRGTAERDYSKRVERVKTKHKVGMAGIWATVLHALVKEGAERELRGVMLIPFDKAGEYVYLRAASEIQQQTIRPEDGINVRDECPVCGRYQYDVFLGPMRYRRDGWNGDDVVYSYFMDTLLFTPRAYEVLRSFDREVERSEPVYLE